MHVAAGTHITLTLTLNPKPRPYAVRNSGHTLYACAARYSDKYPFRMRSETADIAITLSMQPWDAFRPDGVIMFSDILTPLPALGIEFDVVRGKGPIIAEPIRRCVLNPVS